MHRRIGWLTAIAVLAGGTTAAAGSASAAPPQNFDHRGTAAPDKGATAARDALKAQLGPLATVRTARTGGVAEIGGIARLLTGPSSASPEDVALDYVRDHSGVFGLGKDDLAQLQLVAKSVSPDGITHLRYNQVLDGVESYDSGISAHVTRDGRLVSISGAPIGGARLPSTAPALSSGEGLAAARDSAGGSVLAPAVASTERGRATFVTGETARLMWAATGDGPRLTWSVTVDGAQDALYQVLVDAQDGTPLVRTSLTDDLGQARYFVKDPTYGGGPVQLTMPAAWYDDNNGGTRLWGNFARTYTDPADEDPAWNAEVGGSRAQIPASSGTDWLYAQSTSFPGASPCPVPCTWNSADTSTALTNRYQAAVNAHVLTSRYHDYLLQAPIGFDEASGNFQRVNAGGAGAGNDAVHVEVDDSYLKSVPGPDFNNANFSTLPDGSAPRMQMYLWRDYYADVNGSDAADVVYHEYGHGLSNRLTVNASGSSLLQQTQSSQMGEAWSDFYALDLLVQEGSITDTAAPAEVKLGTYVVGPDGIRAKPIDCPANGGGAACNGTFGAPVTGGYTYGDIAGTDNTSPHNGGEVWAETLWDLRGAVGHTAALALVTGGMRLTGVVPSMLDMRDAILRQAVAMRSAPGAADDYYTKVWQVFANRGMGFSATTPSPASTTPTEAFDLPSGLRSGGTATITDPYPGGDADGLFEPGETVQVAQPLTGIGLVDLTGTSGTLTSGDPATTVLDGGAAWPVLGRGRTAPNADALAVKLPSTCDAPVTLSLAATSPEGGVTVPVTIDPRPTDKTVVPIADQSTATATFQARGAGAVSDVDLRIDELRHTYVGDLVITLSHDGVTATVFDPADNFSADDLIDLILDDEAGSGLPTSGAGPISGRHTPSVPGALAAFDGHPVAGLWTLTMTDISAGDIGQLRRWGLNGPEVACGTLEIPAADTGAADSVGQTGATLHGTVTPNGRATGLRFAYGTTTAYGATTPTQDAGAGAGAVAGAAALSGLQPGTTYHVRTEAIREGGVVAVAGPDRTFTTAPAPAPLSIPHGDPGPQPRSIDTTKPTFAGKAKVSLAKAKKGKRAATALFGLSEAATVKAELTRKTTGVKSGRKCVKKTAKRKGKKCALYVAAGKPVSQAFATTAGLKLKLGSLRKGTYALTLTATDAAGNRSAPVKVTFSVR